MTIHRHSGAAFLLSPICSVPISHCLLHLPFLSHLPFFDQRATIFFFSASLLSLSLTLSLYLSLSPPLSRVLLVVSPPVSAFLFSSFLGPLPVRPWLSRDCDTEGNARRAVKVIDITIFLASEPPGLGLLDDRSDTTRQIIRDGEWHAGATSWGVAEGGRDRDRPGVVHARTSGTPHSWGKEATLTPAAHVDGRSSTSQKCKLHHVRHMPLISILGIDPFDFSELSRSMK